MEKATVNLNLVFGILNVIVAAIVPHAMFNAVIGGINLGIVVYHYADRKGKEA